MGCGHRLHLDDADPRTVTTLAGVTRYALRAGRCRHAPARPVHRPHPSRGRGRAALPHRESGLDVVAYAGGRRHTARRTAPEAHAGLAARGVALPARAVTNLLRRSDELRAPAAGGPAATFTVGTPGSFMVTTTGFPAPVLTESGLLHNSLTLANNGDGTATISGTPLATPAGVFGLTITAANGVGPDVTQTLTLAVVRPPEARIVTGTGTGGRPEVKVFDAVTGGPPRALLAFDASFAGGVRVARGDVNGDGGGGHHRRPRARRRPSG